MMMKRLVIAFILLGFVFLSGISGYMLIEGWDFLDSIEVFRVEDINIASDSQLIGKTLKNSGLLDKKGIAVAAVRKGDRYMFNPPENERLETGDAIILIGETKSVREIKKLVG
ncbi:MAG: TrkA C-terminal domain-containing protein [Thermodesulfovibrionales bacterium]